VKVEIGTWPPLSVIARQTLPDGTVVEHFAAEKVQSTSAQSLREVCDASLQALSDDELAAARLRAADEAGRAEQHQNRVEAEFSRRLRIQQAACDHQGWPHGGHCPKCGLFDWDAP
jgi:hypothetical protein